MQKLKINLIFLILLTLVMLAQSFTWKKQQIKKDKHLNVVLDSIIQSSSFKNNMGISVYSITNNQPKYEYQQDVFFTPASVLKLIVTATALEIFPPEKYVSNQIHLEGNIKQDTLFGDIFLIGKGDPHFSQLSFPSAETVMDSYTSLIKKEGINHVVGDVFAIDMFFGKPKYPKTWDTRHQAYCYGSKISALTFNRNCFQVTVRPSKGKITVQIYPNVGYFKIINNASIDNFSPSEIMMDWDLETKILKVFGTMYLNSSIVQRNFPRSDTKFYFVQAFLTSLKRQNMSFTFRKDFINFDEINFTKTMSLKTKPLLDVIDQINQQSQNLQAEMLLRHLGENTNQIPKDKFGLQVEKRFLNDLGLETKGFLLEDGSGLSMKNKITPQSITYFLKSLVSKHYFKQYWQSLAIPGKHGYKPQRIQSLANNVRWKTGYLKGVQSAAGFIYNTQDTLAFSIFVNNVSHKMNLKASQFIDRIIQIVTKIQVL